MLFVTAKEEEIAAPAAGTFELDKNLIRLTHMKKRAFEFPLTGRVFLRVKDGDKVERGQQLTEGQLNPRILLELKGMDATRRYITEEIQQTYNLQGQNINAKHIEAVIRQMSRMFASKRKGIVNTSLAISSIVLNSAALLPNWSPPVKLR